jgi:uncharacterized membrane protein YfcA
MTILTMTLTIFAGSLIAGFLGSLTGLGGGVVIVPLLALGFGVDLREAIGVSLVSVIATSSGAAAAYVKEGFTNVRIGMVLEVGTTYGAILGAFVAALVAKSVLGIMFGVLLLVSAYLSMRGKREEEYIGPMDKPSAYLRLSGTYPTPSGEIRNYNVVNVIPGMVLMFGAGMLSALLGIGSGSIKVLAMDQIMRIPFKVSTTTSNFMIGVTAAASAGIYIGRGYVPPELAMPVTLGVLAGSMLGAKVLIGAQVKLLRIVFATVIVVMGAQMIYKGATGGL